jgi:hypothetical protein
MLKNKHSQKITTVEVAKKTRVSLDTVSRVLNNDMRVAPKKCKRVYAAIQNLMYVANRQVKSLKGRKTNVIGVLVPTWRPVTLARFYMATYKYTDRYPVPSKLSNDINLDVSHFQIEQTLGDNSECYRFASLTNYFQVVSAEEQSQKVWNQSLVLH